MAVRWRGVDGSLLESALARVVVEDLLAGAPVREFRWYRGRRFYSGWYWSATMRRLVAYESRLELARIMLADFDAAVVGIAAQPFQLVGEDGDRIRRHVPDLLLLNDSGLATVVDVKPAHRLAEPDVAAVFTWTRQVVAARGWAFEVWAGADRQVLANVSFLAGYRRRPVVNEALVPVALELAAGHNTIGGLETALTAYAPLEVARPVVLHLLWAGVLRADLGRPLGSGTPIHLSAGDAA
ncbi:TnsA-like heteromeric transposase endonuclease subunit [Micromonospora sp. NPDC006766]|uniref:TnsA-like heteromeric transposase endonuclease subunit n=1 Tax=Micromonospora sp. NPDC006766 TaxID=3154778 RepID=UPI0033FA00F9